MEIFYLFFQTFQIIRW